MQQSAIDGRGERNRKRLRSTAIVDCDCY